MVVTDHILSDCHQTVHLIGVGGVSMSALAEVLHRRGFVVRGSDMNEGEMTRHLQKLGIKIFHGHAAKQVEGADLIIRTAAVSDENPEVVRARELGIPILERAEAWGILMLEYRDVVCFSGTHGKTTSTSMMAHIALEARLNPQIMVGAKLPVLGGGLRVADSNLFIAEACEYCNSFLSFHPTIAVILNVDADHLDFFSGIDDIITSFAKFAEKVPENGCVIYNADDAHAFQAVEGLAHKAMSFGIEREADVMAKNILFQGDHTTFHLVCGGEEIAIIRLQVLGKHNVYNALSACAVALRLGISPKCMAAGLAKFTGAGRRFEYKGEYHGAKVYDDYAHHPNEVKATLTAAKTLGYDRIICAFQPHTYTRTAALKEQFAEALALADVVYLAEIYAAREKNTIGITAEAISRLIPNARYIPTKDSLCEALREVARPGDLILTMGAGDIYEVSERLIECE